jgi:methylmalonyl-CoA mutase N-terminal domain/subunit
MRALLDGIPLADVTTSLTINATAASLLLLYQLVAEEQGVVAADIGGTVQNDILKEYAARGTYIYPPQPSMRLVTDLFAYCAAELPAWNTISISGYHIREAGSTAAQEIGFTIANALAYVEAARLAGLDVDDFAPRLSFFWNAHSNFLEEVAKYRAARRLWARLMRDRVGARRPASWRMRFHTQTAGSSLTAQQPLTNVVRTALEALSAVLGGTQSLHTNSYDEALGLPTEDAATLALRTQQIIAHESGVTGTVDPLAGSYVIEHLTDELEREALQIIEWVDRNGGAVAAVESGLMQGEIENSAYRAAREVETGEQIIVGVNRFQTDEATAVPSLSLDPDLEPDQVKRLSAHKSDRADPTGELEEVRRAARDTTNLLYPMKAALAAGATIGEVSNVLRGVFGVYRP